MTGRRVTQLQGEDALAMLVRVYVDGFTTGMGSCLATFVPDVPEPERDSYVHKFVSDMLDDPAIREEIRTQVVETLTGTDSGGRSVPLLPPTGERP